MNARRTRLDEQAVIAELGQLPDRLVAVRHGWSLRSVQRERSARGIPACTRHMATIRQQVETVALLAEQYEPVTAEQVASALEMHPHKVRSNLRSLAADGLALGLDGGAASEPRLWVALVDEHPLAHAVEAVVS